MSIAIDCNPNLIEVNHGRKPHQLSFNGDFGLDCKPGDGLSIGLSVLSRNR